MGDNTRKFTGTLLVYISPFSTNPMIVGVRIYQPWIVVSFYVCVNKINIFLKVQLIMF